METEILAAAGAIDLSFIGLFRQAPLLVKAVMVMLMLASVWSWGLALNKWMQLRAARQAHTAFEESFWSGEPLDRLFAEIGTDPQTPSEEIFVAAMAEWTRSAKSEGGMIPGAGLRISRAMDVAVGRASGELQSGLGWLATIGTTTPFIGLFGTVFGIMNAFLAIAASQNTNIAVVAPGIAEALLATGLGLFAAIPAVVFYNHLSQGVDRVAASYEAFADEFALLLNRQIGG